MSYNMKIIKQIFISECHKSKHQFSCCSMMITSSKLLYLLLEILHGINNTYAFRFIGGLNRDHRNFRNIPGLNLDRRNFRNINGLNRNIGGFNRHSKNLCMNRIINGCEILPGIVV